MITQDYSVWLTPERLAAEERLWKEVAIYRLYADAVLRTCEEEGCRSVLEIGCGTGWVPTLLPSEIDYTGVDANEGCLALARQKSGARFLNADIRGLQHRPVDLVCSFAVLKHFALQEWTGVLARVLSFGRIGLFTMNVGPFDRDDFEQGFAHTWIGQETLEAAVAAAGHRIVDQHVIHTFETMVRTCIR